MSLKRFLKKSSTPHMSAQESVKEAIGRMIDSGSGVVLVTNAEGALEGIVSERDVMTRVTGEERNPNTTSLSEIMTTEIVTVSPEMDLDDAIYTMREHRIRHLPVLEENGCIAGMISLRYLLDDRGDERMDEVRSLVAYMNDAPGG
jgi:CBS domain-containing protein